MSDTTTDGLHVDITLTRGGKPVASVPAEIAVAVLGALDAAFPGIKAAAPAVPHAVIGAYLSPQQERVSIELNRVLSGLDIGDDTRAALRASIALPTGWVAVRADDLDLNDNTDQRRLAERAQDTLYDVTIICADANETTRPAPSTDA